MLNKYITVLIITVLASSCYKDYDNTNETETTELPTTIINTKLSGSFENQNGVELQEYTIEWVTGSEDISGKYFLIDLEKISKYDNTLWVRKNDEVVGMAHLPLFENDINSILFKAFSDEKIETLTSNSTISINNNIKLSADPSQSSNESTSVTYRIIEDANHITSHGYELDNSLIALSNVSIINVDFTTAENLNFNIRTEDSKSVLKLDIEKDAWVLLEDLESGVHIDEGGYFAVANVQPGIMISGRVISEDNTMSYQWYEILERGRARSSAKGNWINVVPQNTELNIDILNPCKDRINQETITTSTEPLVEDLSVGPQAIVQEIETEVIDCDGNLTSEAVIQVSESGGGPVLYFFSDAEIKTSIPLCGNSFSIAAYDISTETAGLAFPWATEIEDEITYLSTCPQFVNGYSLYKINGVTKIYPTFELSQTANDIILNSIDENLKLVIRGNEKGSYEVDMINVKFHDPDFGPNGYSVSCENSLLGCGIDDCFVSHLGENDNWVRVTFSGMIWMQTLAPLTAGRFPVEGIIICKSN